MKDFNTYLEEQFKNEDFFKEYYRTATFYKLADQLLNLRKKRGLTQIELAEKAETTQAVVSRMENVSVHPSLETVVKMAEALGAIVEVRITPVEEISSPDTNDSDDCIKRQDLLKKISYFESESLTSGNSWRFTEESRSLSSKPSFTPLKKKEKVPEFA
jgi:transcriptional regulator with XRE-family HTH domain